MDGQAHNGDSVLMSDIEHHPHNDQEINEFASNEINLKDKLANH